MHKLILASILVAAASPALAQNSGANPGTVIGNVYENPEAGWGYGIGHGFGLPDPRHYRYVPGYGYVPIGAAEGAPARHHARREKRVSAN
jgi:hypothetical protein